MSEKKVTLRVPSDIHKLIKNQADVSGLSMNQYLIKAARTQIQIDTGLYDFNDIALQRLNQLTDVLVGFSKRMDVLSDQLDAQNKLFSQYFIGENYLK